MTDTPDTAPKRIWRCPSTGKTFNGPGPTGTDIEYIRDDVHTRLMADAFRQGMLRAAELVGKEASSFPDNVAWAVEDLGKAIRAEAEAEAIIRAALEEAADRAWKDSGPTLYTTIRALATDPEARARIMERVKENPDD